MELAARFRVNAPKLLLPSHANLGPKYNRVLLIQATPPLSEKVYLNS